MTYSLNTLNSTPPPRSLAARLGHEVTLVLGCLALLLWVLAMCSYSTQDAAWSTSGMGQGVHNWVGRLGAWLADSSYFMFGFSVWWVLVAFAYAWLASLVRWMRGSHSAEAAAVRSISSGTPVAEPTWPPYLLAISTNSLGTNPWINAPTPTPKTT